MTDLMCALTLVLHQCLSSLLLVLMRCECGLNSSFLSSHRIHKQQSPHLFFVYFSDNQYINQLTCNVLYILCVSACILRQKSDFALLKYFLRYLILTLTLKLIDVGYSNAAGPTSTSHQAHIQQHKDKTQATELISHITFVYVASYLKHVKFILPLEGKNIIKLNLVFLFANP